MVVVDKFTKMAHFIPCTTTITLTETAKLFVDRIFRYHGLPTSIVSDWGTQFDSEFWREYWRSLGCTPLLSIAYHPETDGQTERINSILNQYLHVYTSYMQENWPELLVTAEFAHNNAVHSATGVTPFFANTDMHPRTAHLEALFITDSPTELTEHMKELTMFLNENLTAAAEDMKRFADLKRHKGPDYAPGDEVMLSTKNFQSPRPKAKWSDKIVGPFKIIKEAYPNSDAYILELPESYDIHPVFHTSLLKPFKHNTIEVREEPIPPAVIVKGVQQYEVKQILAWKPYYKKQWFLVKWKGYDNPVSNEWIHEDYLQDCTDLVESFMSTNPPSTNQRSNKRQKGEVNE